MIFSKVHARSMVETHDDASLLRWRFIALLMVLVFSGSLQSQESVPPVDLVNPHIGGISHMLMPTFPTVHHVD